MFVTDITEIGTLECRSSSSLYRVEADVFSGKGTRQPHMQAVISCRGKDEFTVSLNCSDTHYSEEKN